MKPNAIVRDTPPSIAQIRSHIDGFRRIQQRYQTLLTQSNALLGQMREEVPCRRKGRFGQLLSSFFIFLQAEVFTFWQYQEKMDETRRFIWQLKGSLRHKHQQLRRLLKKARNYQTPLDELLISLRAIRQEYITDDTGTGDLHEAFGLFQGSLTRFVESYLFFQKRVSKHFDQKIPVEESIRLIQHIPPLPGEIDEDSINVFMEQNELLMDQLKQNQATLLTLLQLAEIQLARQDKELAQLSGYCLLQRRRFTEQRPDSPLRPYYRIGKWILGAGLTACLLMPSPTVKAICLLILLYTLIITFKHKFSFSISR